MNPQISRLFRLSGVFSVLVVVPVILNVNGVSPVAASVPAERIHPGLVVLHHETLPATLLGKAHRLSAVNPSGKISISLGLPFRHRKRLTALDGQLGHVHPLSPSQFNARFAPSRSEVRRLNRWLHTHHLRLTYQAGNGLTTVVTGTVRALESALNVRFDAYRLRGHGFIANNGNPVVPTRLHLQSIAGLNTLQRPVADHVRRTDVRRPEGFIPKDFRRAYGISGHTVNASGRSVAVDGSGQTIGFTLFGAPLPDAALAEFSAETGDTKLVSCGGSGPSCRKANTIHWVPVGGKDKYSGALLETALDVEYAHAMAPNSRLKYFLASSNVDTFPKFIANIVMAVSKAASDPSLKVISNSWHLWIDGPNDSFARITGAIFQQAATEGKTFYFASGDEGLDSGCPIPSDESGNPLCDAANYPAASPYVASVGGTNLQMNRRFSARTLESTWNWLLTAQGPEGTGGGCAINGESFPRPAWQLGVRLAASCTGRAQPDFSADADPQSGAHVVASGRESCPGGRICAVQIGGTSLATPLWAGMHVTWNRYLQLNGKPNLSFTPPLMYGLAWSPAADAPSALYYKVFHDIRCGYNGYPAAYGWDQATGWGSPNWSALAHALAGQTVRQRVPPADAGDCRLVEQRKALRLSLLRWPPNTYEQQNADGVFTISRKQAGNVRYNPVRLFHSKGYAFFGYKGGMVDFGHIGLGNDFNPTGEWLGSLYPGTFRAARVVNDVVANLADHGVPDGDCSSLQLSTPAAVSNCHEFPLYFTNAKGNPTIFVDYFIYQEGNAVAETYVQAAHKTAESDPWEFGKDALWIALAGMTRLDVATNTPGFNASVPLDTAGALKARPSSLQSTVRSAATHRVAHRIKGFYRYGPTPASRIPLPNK